MATSSYIDAVLRAWKLALPATPVGFSVPRVARVHCVRSLERTDLSPGSAIVEAARAGDQPRFPGGVLSPTSRCVTAIDNLDQVARTHGAQHD